MMMFVPSLLWATETQVFSCTTTNNKQIKVNYLGKGSFRYTFGSKNKAPDLSFIADKHNAELYQWHGSGRSIHYSVEIKNGNSNYLVFWSMDRLDDNHPVTAGIEVTTPDSPKTLFIPCSQKYPIINELDTIEPY